MTDKKPRTPEEIAQLDARLRASSSRKIVIVVLLGAVVGVVAMRNEGYALLIESATPPAPTPTDVKYLVRMDCTYFTGTERVITHVWRKAEESKSGCPWVNKVGRGGLIMPGPGDVGAPDIVIPMPMPLTPAPAAPVVPAQ